MKRHIIRLTESDLHNIIKTAVNSLMENSFDERHVLKLKDDSNDLGDLPPMGEDMPPIDEPPMNEPPMNEPPLNEPPMDDNDPSAVPPMNDEESNDDMPPMDEPNDADGGNTQEIDDIFNQLGIEDQSAVLKYAKSMSDNNGDANNPQEMPMEAIKYANLDAIIKEIMDLDTRGKDRTVKRNSKDVTNDKIDNTNPFISRR